MGDRPSILVPIRVLEGESVPEGVPELLANAHVVLLGYHVIPDQTAPGQARMQFEDRGKARLDEYETIFADAGATISAASTALIYNNRLYISQVFDPFILVCNVPRDINW